MSYDSLELIAILVTVKVWTRRRRERKETLQQRKPQPNGKTMENQNRSGLRVGAKWGGKRRAWGAFDARNQKREVVPRRGDGTTACKRVGVGRRAAGEESRGMYTGGVLAECRAKRRSGWTNLTLERVSVVVVRGEGYSGRTTCCEEADALNKRARRPVLQPRTRQRVVARPEMCIETRKPTIERKNTRATWG